jgi:predicted deacylase
MNKIELKKSVKYTDEKRIIGEVRGSELGPTVVIFAGIHGNEKAGVLAAEKVLKRINDENYLFKGNVHFILGNINALNKDVRFQDADLNRIWTHEKMEELQNQSFLLDSETKEQIQIYSIVRQIVNSERGPFYFLDLHTTSSPSVPFITISDSLNNRKFATYFPLPVVLGLEEFLEGPLLTFINDHGYVALGFEGGQHTDPESIINCEYFIWKSLVHSGCIDREQVKDYEKYREYFAGLCCSHQFFAITYRYGLSNGQDFRMRPDFDNFEMIHKNQLLAYSDGLEIHAERKGRIFMPLYQRQGEDGFFILKRVSKFWLEFSKVARKWKINHFLRLIPGVKQDPENAFILLVDPRIARFLAKDIFHLFGYRQQIFKDDKLHFIKRDRKQTQLL